MNISYCDRWSNVSKEPFNIFDADKARQNHLKKELYTAIIVDNGKVINTVEITNKYITVAFMNENINPYLFYNFNVKENGDIFLTAAYYYSYDEKSNKKTKFMAFSYKENGYIVMEMNDFIKNEREERDLYDDVTPNWDKFPEFGKYDHLIRKER